MTTSRPAIYVSDLCREFSSKHGPITALAGVDLTVAEGEVVGLLGSNGAGKTTLTKILSTLLLPTSGTAQVLGHDVVSQTNLVRRSTGVVFGGEKGLYGRLNARDNLRYFATLAGVGRRELRSRLDESLEEVGLAEAARRPVDTYSKGMRQRLHIAIGMIGRPRVLLLDEPTVGLDPIEAERLRGTIGGLRETGVAVLLTSHQLIDIERLASRVYLLSEGSLAAEMTVEAFAKLADYSATVTVRGRGEPPRSAAPMIDRLEVVTAASEDGLWTAKLRLRDWHAQTLTQLGDYLGGADIVDVNVVPVRLEDVYTQIAPRLEAERR